VVTGEDGGDICGISFFSKSGEFAQIVQRTLDGGL
jgi:hypothetical protein